MLEGTNIDSRGKEPIDDKVDVLLQRFETASIRVKDKSGFDAHYYRDAIEVLRSIETHYQGAALFHTYRFHMEPDGAVDFTLPTGATFRELFEDCNEYALRQWGSPALDHSMISRASTDKARFQCASRIIPIIPGTLARSRDEQSKVAHSLRLLIPTLENATAAAALYFCMTGKDFFDGNSARTAGEVALTFGPRGLSVDDRVNPWQARIGVGCAGTPIIG
jgi:hypothetical protein